jgi:HTH-type transcriptional regulator / antitoxin HigA
MKKPEITDKASYEAGLAKMETLLTKVGNDTPPDNEAFQELNVLSEAIATYEETHYAFEPTSLKEMIELRMYQRKLRQKDVAELLGTSPSRISEVLNGKRKLTFELAKGLYQKLNIDPDLIFNS